MEDRTGRQRQATQEQDNMTEMKGPTSYFKPFSNTSLLQQDRRWLWYLVGLALILAVNEHKLNTIRSEMSEVKNNLEKKIMTAENDFRIKMMQLENNFEKRMFETENNCQKTFIEIQKTWQKMSSEYNDLLQQMKRNSDSPFMKVFDIISGIFSAFTTGMRLLT